MCGGEIKCIEKLQPELFFSRSTVFPQGKRNPPTGSVHLRECECVGDDDYFLLTRNNDRVWNVYLSQTHLVLINSGVKWLWRSYIKKIKILGSESADLHNVLV